MADENMEKIGIFTIFPSKSLLMLNNCAIFATEIVKYDNISRF